MNHKYSTWLIIFLFCLLLIGGVMGIDSISRTKTVTIDKVSYTVPDGYNLISDNTKFLEQKINELENEITTLENSPKPSNTELIEWGKQCHPYYMELYDLNLEKENYEMELLSN